MNRGGGVLYLLMNMSHEPRAEIGPKAGVVILPIYIPLQINCTTAVWERREINQGKCPASVIAAILLLGYVMTGCTSDKKIEEDFFATYRFDTAVLERLPLYDSLASEVLKYQPYFVQAMEEILIIVTDRV